MHSTNNTVPKVVYIYIYIYIYTYIQYMPLTKMQAHESY